MVDVIYIKIDHGRIYSASQTTAKSVHGKISYGASKIGPFFEFLRFSEGSPALGGSIFEKINMPKVLSVNIDYNIL